MTDNSPPPGQVVIAGGGTAGWMAACLLRHRWAARGVAVTLVESAEIGTVGVGEGSTPYLRGFFATLGLAERDWRPVSMPARLVREVANRDARPHFMAACWAEHDRDAGPAIEVLAQQGSAALVSLARADVLVEVPAQSRLQAGAWVKVLPLHVDGR